MVVEIWYRENCQKVKNPVKQRKVVPFRRSCHTYLSILFIAFCGRYCYCRWWWCARWDCWNRPHCDVSFNKNSNGDLCLCLFKASHTLSGKKTVIWMRLDKPACVVLLQIIKVPCSGKLLQIGKNTIFAEKICADCWLLPHQRMPRPRILWRKLLRIATNRKIHKKFSPSKVSRYMVLRKKMKWELILCL